MSNTKQLIEKITMTGCSVTITEAKYAAYFIMVVRGDSLDETLEAGVSLAQELEEVSDE